MNKVSVIMPVFNGSRKLDKTIKSVINQTYSNWELIIVDDASKDRTWEIIEKWKGEDSRIKGIKNEKNKGCYCSMNDGIKIAEGNFITRIDAGDVFNKDKLSTQIALMEKRPNLIGVRAYYKRGNILRTHNAITLLYKKEAIEKIGYYDSVRFGADDEFFNRLRKAYGSGKVHLIEKVLYLAEVDPNSLTRNRKTRIGCPARVNYVDNFRIWHANMGKPHMAYPLEKRPFPVNRIMLP